MVTDSAKKWGRGAQNPLAIGKAGGNRYVEARNDKKKSSVVVFLQACTKGSTYFLSHFASLSSRVALFKQISTLFPWKDVSLLFQPWIFSGWFERKQRVRGRKKIK